MDTAMNAYLLHHYDAAPEEEQQRFESLLHEQDPDIMVWLNDQNTTNRYTDIIRKIRETLVTGA